MAHVLVQVVYLSVTEPQHQSTEMTPVAIVYWLIIILLLPIMLVFGVGLGVASPWPQRWGNERGLGVIDVAFLTSLASPSKGTKYCNQHVILYQQRDVQHQTNLPYKSSVAVRSSSGGIAMRKVMSKVSGWRKFSRNDQLRLTQKGLILKVTRQGAARIWYNHTFSSEDEVW